MPRISAMVHPAEVEQLRARSLTFRLGAPTLAFDDLDRFVRYVRRLLVDVSYAVAKEYSAWIVTDLQYGSATISAAPAPRLSTAGAVLETTVFDGIAGIVGGGSKPPFFSEAAVRYVALVGRMSELEPVEVRLPGRTPIAITSATVRHAKELIRPRIRFYGSVLGSLEVLSVHGGKHVTIYCDNRDVVRCKLDEPLFSVAIDLLGKRVVVGGFISANRLGNTLAIDAESLQLAPPRPTASRVASLYGSIPEFFAETKNSAELLDMQWSGS